MQTIWSFKYTYVFYLSLCSIYNWLSLLGMKCWQVFYRIITEYPSSIITLQLLLAINLRYMHVRSHRSYLIQTKYGPSLPDGHEWDSAHPRYPVKAGITPAGQTPGTTFPQALLGEGQRSVFRQITVAQAWVTAEGNGFITTTTLSSLMCWFPCASLFSLFFFFSS